MLMLQIVCIIVYVYIIYCVLCIIRALIMNLKPIIHNNVQERMLICEHDIQLQPAMVDHYENFDWTQAARIYSNLDEVPSFISSHRG